MIARHLDIALGEEGLGAKLQADAIRLAHEIGLGQGRALVGQAGFVAEKADPTAVAFVPQGGRDLKPSLASSDDDDTATRSRADVHVNDPSRAHRDPMGPHDCPVA